jgi:hypothetical protein
VFFEYKRRQYVFNIGEMDQIEAKATKVRELLALLKWHLLDLPPLRHRHLPRPRRQAALGPAALVPA